MTGLCDHPVHGGHFKHHLVVEGSRDSVGQNFPCFLDTDSILTSHKLTTRLQYVPASMIFLVGNQLQRQSTVLATQRRVPERCLLIPNRSNLGSPKTECPVCTGPAFQPEVRKRSQLHTKHQARGLIKPGAKYQCQEAQIPTIATPVTVLSIFHTRNSYSSFKTSFCSKSSPQEQQEFL